MSRVTREEIAQAHARLAAEELKPIRQVCHLIGPSVTPATALRYVYRGRAGVHLDALQVGGEWLASAEACARFVTAQKGIGARLD